MLTKQINSSTRRLQKFIIMVEIKKLRKKARKQLGTCVWIYKYFGPPHSHWPNSRHKNTTQLINMNENRTYSILQALSSLFILNLWELLFQELLMIIKYEQ